MCRSGGKVRGRVEIDPTRRRERPQVREMYAVVIRLDLEMPSRRWTGISGERGNEGVCLP